MSIIVPLLDAIIFAILYSGGSSFFFGIDSGCKTSLIFFMAVLYYSFTGMSRRVKTGASSSRERARAAPSGWITIDENGFITWLNIMVLSD